MIILVLQKINLIHYSLHQNFEIQQKNGNAMMIKKTDKTVKISFLDHNKDFDKEDAIKVVACFFEDKDVKDFFDNTHTNETGHGNDNITIGSGSN